MGEITAAAVGAVTAAAVGAVVGAVINALMANSIPAVLKGWKYRRNLKKYMDTLRKRVIGLNQLKADVELRKRNLRRGRMVKNEVEHWLSCVKIINAEVQIFENLCSAISGSCLAKAWLGKTVLGKIGEVEKLCKEGKFPGDIGIDRPSTPGAKLPFFAVKKIFKKLKKVGAVTNALMGILMPAVSRKQEDCRNLKKNMNTLREGVVELNQQKGVIDRPSTSGAKLLFSTVKKSLKKLKKVGAVTNALMGILMPAVSRKLEYCRNLKKNMNTLRKGLAKLLFSPVKESFKELKHALDRLNRRKEEVESLKSRHETAGEVVSEKVNDWLIAVRSINAVIQILEDVSSWVSPCDVHKFNEIVLEKSQEVNILHQRGTFPDGIVIANRRKPKRGQGHMVFIGFMLLYLFVTLSSVQALDLAATTYFMF